MINIGVQGWASYEDSFDFPHRMNVSTSGNMQFSTAAPLYIDFKTGKTVGNWVAPSPGDMFAALQRYLDVMLKYEDMMLPGFFGFPGKNNIPEDLTMPMKDLVKKYDLGATLPLIWDATAMGLGDAMNVPALFFMQAFPVPIVKAVLGMGVSAVPPSGRLYDLYEKVAAFLGTDVLYSTTVVSAKRDDNGVRLVVHDTSGKATCINAKRLLVSAQPTPEMLAPLQPDAQEKEVFDKLLFSTVYAGLVRHPSLVPQTAYTNRLPNSTAQPIFPVAPQVGRLEWVGNTVDLFQLTTVGTATDTTASMQGYIGDAVDAMIAAGTVAPNSPLSFSKFANHGKMHARVTEADLKGGFINDLMGLQGRHSTWWTGATWSAGMSNVIWQYNKVLLPKLIENM